MHRGTTYICGAGIYKVDIFEIKDGKLPKGKSKYYALILRKDCPNALARPVLGDWSKLSLLPFSGRKWLLRNCQCALTLALCFLVPTIGILCNQQTANPQNLSRSKIRTLFFWNALLIMFLNATGRIFIHRTRWSSQSLHYRPLLTSLIFENYRFFITFLQFVNSE